MLPAGSIVCAVAAVQRLMVNGAPGGEKPRIAPDSGRWAPQSRPNVEQLQLTGRSSMRRQELNLAFGTVCLGLLFLPGSEIRAADLSVRAPVCAVTVFPDRAEVTRIIEATVPAGATTLVLEGLP